MKSQKTIHLGDGKLYTPVKVAQILNQEESLGENLSQASLNEALKLCCENKHISLLSGLEFVDDSFTIVRDLLTKNMLAIRGLLDAGASPDVFETCDMFFPECIGFILRCAIENRLIELIPYLAVGKQDFERAQMINIACMFTYAYENKYDVNLDVFNSVLDNFIESKDHTKFVSFVIQKALNSDRSRREVSLEFLKQLSRSYKADSFEVADDVFFDKSTGDIATLDEFDPEFVEWLIAIGIDINSVFPTYLSNILVETPLSFLKSVDLTKTSIVIIKDVIKLQLSKKNYSPAKLQKSLKRPELDNLITMSLISGIV